MASNEEKNEFEAVKDKTLLFVGPFPPPFGGVASHLSELANSFVPAGCNFHVLQFQAETEEPQVSGGAIVHRRGSRLYFGLMSIIFRSPIRFVTAVVVLFINLWKDPRLYVASFVRALHVAQLAHEIDAEKVSVYTTKIGALIPFLRILSPKLGILYCIFADPYKNPDFYKTHRSWYRRAMLNSDKVFSSSCYCAEAVGHFTKDIDPSVIYIGVDLERFRPLDASEARAKLGLPDQLTILFVGRMEPEMGAANALEIAQLIIKSEPNVSLVIAGAKGALTENIKAAALQSKGSIFCRVNVPGDDLPYYYGAATVIIAPTLGTHACMGVAIKEAMASGRPSVASNSGGIPEAIRQGVDGVIVPLNVVGEIDNERFAEEVKNLARKPDICKKYGQAARGRCEEMFSVNSTASKYLGLLDYTD